MNGVSRVDRRRAGDVASRRREGRAALSRSVGAKRCIRSRHPTRVRRVRRPGRRDRVGRGRPAHTSGPSLQRPMPASGMPSDHPRLQTSASPLRTTRPWMPSDLPTAMAAMTSGSTRARSCWPRLSLPPQAGSRTSTGTSTGSHVEHGSHIETALTKPFVRGRWGVMAHLGSNAVGSQRTAGRPPGCVPRSTSNLPTSWVDTRDAYRDALAEHRRRPSM